MKQIRSSPIPVIAKVDGVAAAAGCQLVAQETASSPQQEPCWMCGKDDGCQVGC